MNMMTTNIIFILLAGLAVYSAFSVIAAKNPIHSVFYLVLSFANVAFLMLLLGIEFLSILFLIVYVGAIAILFLFVVMMLNIKSVEIADNATRYVPVGFIIGIIFILQIFKLVQERIQLENSPFIINVDNFDIIQNPTNIQLLGEILYTEYFLWFLIASFILLVAMLGAIVLTLEHEKIKRQDIFAQIATDYKKTIKLKK